MKRRMALWFLCLTAVCLPAGLLKAQEIVKDNNVQPLNDAASWVGGAVPSNTNVAVWDATVSDANAVNLGAPMTWDGIRIANPGGTVTINGADRLTLDGGATVDVDLGAATQNLTLNTPVTLNGSSVVAVNANRTLAFNGGASVGAVTKNGAGRLSFGGATGVGGGTYAAGLTVYEGPTTLNGDHKLTGGTVTLRGITTMTSGSTEALAVFNGTLVLDGGALTMTNTISSRFFAGRTNADSDGLLIVSNGTHTILGANNSNMANFIGVSGAKRGRLHMEGGSLSVVFLRLATNQKSGNDVDELVVNNGTLTVTGTTGSDPMTKAFKMGTRFDESVDAASRSGRLEINGGRFEVPNGTVQIATDVAASTGAQEIYLNGGVWAVKKIAIGSSPNVARTLYFDGGVLQGTNVIAASELVDGCANATCKVRAGGALLDSVDGNDFVVTLNLVADPASPNGGLVKLGSGRLTLGGVNTYTGPTIVSNGTLCVTGTLAVTNLVVEPGAAFSLADGALSRCAPASLRIGSAAQPSRLEFEVAASGSACDTLVLPAGARLQKVEVSLFQQGTRNPLAREGDFPILTYTGTAPSVGWLSWGTPVKGFTCAFELDAATRTVYARMRIDSSSSESVWINPGSGAWVTAANWNVMPGDAAGTRVLFGEIALAPATVTLDAPFTVGQMVFSNNNAYTLSGAGSLTLDNGTASPLITVCRGAHAVALPLAPAAPLAVNAAAGASLTLNAAISGPAGLVKQGSGDLIFTADNTYAGGTAIQNGVLALQAGASAGTAPISIAANGARLRAAGTDPVTVSNTVIVAASGGVLDAIAPMTLSGTLDWATGQPVLNKYGYSELIFKGSANETGSYQIKHCTGTFRVAEGGSILINNANVRDTVNLSETTTLPRLFVVETGAVVVAGGILTGSGPSNTVYVNGGSLTLTGSGTAGESGLIRTVTDVPGTDRIIIDAGTLSFSSDDWLSVGVRGGGAEIVVNGGTATFGRLSLGVRGDTTFSSSGVYTDAKVWVNGGVMEVAGAFNWMGDVMVGRTNRVFLSGGTLRLPATLRSALATAANSSELTLNGGTLALSGLGNFGTTSLDNYLRGLNDLYVDQGGAVIDTLGNSATITQALLRAGSTTGGLTKRGAGSLTLSGPCGAVGTTAVEEGALRFASTAATTGLVLSNGVALSLRNGGFDVLTLGTAVLADGARLDLDVAPDSAACDTLALPEGATLGDLVIGLYNVGTDTPVTRAETYPLFAYTGEPPDVSGLCLAPECFGMACTFVVNTGAHTVDAQLTYTSAQVTWANAGAGNWSAAENWSPLAPAAAGAVTRFGSALAADATVTVDGPVSVAGMIFDHTRRYTLSGSAVTLSNGVGAAAVEVVAGSHTLASPLALTGSTVASIAPGAELKLSDVATGNGGLTVEGGGQLTLDGTNNTPTTVRGGATVAVPGAASLGGAALTLDGGKLVVAASDTLAGTVTLGAAGGTFSAGAGQTLLLDAAVTGAGGLTKAGAGTMTLGASADGYAGTTTSGGGTLSVPEFSAGGLVLGRGTLAYTGASTASSQPVTLASGTNAAVLRTASDLTFSGPFSTVSGAFFKSGAGTVTITGANSNQLGLANAANMGGVAAAGADGDGPTVGYGAFNVAEGRVTLGAAGQTNVISGALLVGLNTTAAADAETAGELVVAGGLTVCQDWAYVGRNNGTTVTAPGGRASRLVVQDGELNTVNLSLGGAAGFAGYTGRPVLEIRGGLCTVQALLFAGETAGGVSTVWVNGGTLRHLATTETSLRLGNTGGEGVLRLSSGNAEFTKDVILAGNAGCTGTVELAGGMLTAQNIYKLNAGGYSRILFNGGVFRPTGGGLSGIDSVKIGDGPAIFDTSLYSGTGYNLAQSLSGVGATDGGLVKAGTNTLTINAAMAYNGPTVVSGGVMRVLGSLPATSALTLAPGARLTLNNAAVKKVTVSGLTLGDAEETMPAELEFGIDSPNMTNDQIVVNGDVTAHQAAFHLYWLSSQTDNMVANGSYALMRWTGSGPSSVEAFSVANPQAGKQYVFTVADKVLWLTVGAATSGANHVWTSAGGGDWSESAKWVSAPGAGAVGAAVRFDESATAAADVRLNQNTTLGQLYFNNTNAYTLSPEGASAMTVDNGAAAAVVQVEKGLHVVAVPLALQGELDVKPVSGAGLTLAAPVSGAGGLVKQNGGDLILSGANSFTGGVRLTAGTVTLTNGATTGTGTLAVESDGSSVRVVGSVPSVCPGSLALRTPQAYVNVGPQAKLTLAGELRYESGTVVTNTLVKQGAGEMALAGAANAAADNARINIQEGTLRFASGADCRIGKVNREVVRMDADNGRARTLAVDAGAKAALSGIYMGNGTNAVVVDGALDLTGDFDAACLRIQSALAEDRFTVRSGGTVTCPQATWFNVGVRGPGVLSVEGGAARLGCVSLGYQQRPLDYYGGAYGRVFVRQGGLLDVSGKWNWMGDTNNPARVNLLLVGDGTTEGNTARLPPTTLTTTNGWSSLGLDNGTLVTTGSGLTPPVAGNYLNGLKQLYVSGNGGTFDTAGQSVTLSQVIGSDTAGGTVVKAGAGTLTLAQPLRWDGTVDVRGGTLSAALGAASVRQSAPSNLLARYSFENGPAADTSGNGRHGVSQGVTSIGDGTNGLKGLTFATGQSSVCVPLDAAIRGLANFTVTMWVWVNNVTDGAGTGTTFFTTRKDGGSNGPYEFMIRMNTNKVRFMSTGTNTTSWAMFDTTGAVPGANQWFHLAYVVTPSGVNAYINGVLAGSSTLDAMKTTLLCPPDRPLNQYGFGFGHYQLSAPAASQFKGRMDDVRVYGRALAQAEIQQTINTATALPDLRVAGGAVFAPQGTNEVRDLSGEGFVSGALTVCGGVSPGDGTNAIAGAVLQAENLTLGTNAVYRWHWSPAASDELQVNGLTIRGAGAVDLGRTEGDLINGSFRAVLMRYETIAGAEYFANWTLINAGGKGFNAVIKAENGEVVLEFASTRGTLMWLK
ncbi:MAG TPA: autotransporter-associated beta strand repeat-containing protein [Kiritimatiellia bacterium]|nr:autotransporter-associated beta strand repeat-containing protein [Kiritimatiellia bacterium]HPS07786.1 autotransporter-associated beta strand repeat-containing protein [Kiritimatiellia bacterium]